jgi:hypothetical protein
MNDNELIGDEKPDAATLQFLKCVFPDGLAESEYFPILHILRQDMTIRAASSLVGVLLSKNYLDVYNDALYVNTTRYVPDIPTIEGLKKRLAECGYEDWLDS